MEDHKDDVILILAGYQDEMENFLNTNPGLRSRFPIHIKFPDYSKYELMQIAELICAKRQYKLNGEAKTTLMRIFSQTGKNGNECFGNARIVRNIIEKAIRRQAVRLIAKTDATREELMILEPCDLSPLTEVGECGNA